jgi:hypothetical protein
LRKESKIIVPDRNIELAAATIPDPRLAYGMNQTYREFAQLAKKGTIKFTSYEEMKAR